MCTATGLLRQQHAAKKQQLLLHVCYITFYVDNYYNYTWDAVFVQLLKLLSLNWYRQLSKNSLQEIACASKAWKSVWTQTLSKTDQSPP